MSRVDEHKTVIYLHVPKAAGTTLNNVIQRQYPRGTVFILNGQRPHVGWAEFQRLPEGERARFRVVLGHMTFGLHEHLPQPCTYVTILRDPVERLISMYYYVLQKPLHYLYTTVTTRRMSLADFVRSGLSPEIDNCQTRLLAGAPVFGVGPGFAECSGEMLEQAKANLQQFAVVGLCEQFDESLLLLKHTLGWKFPLYQRENVTRGRPVRESISEEELELIAAHNQWDIELYMHAKNLFEQLIARQGSAFYRELAAFRWLNARLASPYLTMQQAVGRLRGAILARC